jgi:hypothetical protein
MLPEDRAAPRDAEEACAKALGREFLHERHPLDFRRRDNGWGLELKTALRGLRDIRDGAVQLAYVGAAPGAPARLALVLLRPPVSVERLRKEWEDFRRVLAPELGRKLHLVVLGEGRGAVLPPHPELERLAGKLRPVFGNAKSETAPAAPKLPSEKFFDVFTFLLARWLRDPAPVSVKALLGGTGASYTSVSSALRRLQDAGEVSRRRNGDVELPGFPWSTWREVTAVLQPLRASRGYKDGSGRGIRPSTLLPALRKAGATGVGVGGVIAANRRDPHFDLHGMPRLDLTVHGARGLDELARSLHPSLRPADPGAPDAVLALHPLKRRANLFEPDAKRGFAWADDVETLLDLTELKLLEQADALIHRLVKREPA